MPIGLAVLWNSLPVALFLLALGKWILDAKLQTKCGWWRVSVWSVWVAAVLSKSPNLRHPPLADPALR